MMMILIKLQHGFKINPPIFVISSSRVRQSISQGVLLTRLRQLVWDHLSLKS